MTWKDLACSFRGALISALVFLAAGLSNHPAEAKWWGYLEPALAFGAWLSLVLGPRFTTKRNDQVAPPGVVTAEHVKVRCVADLVLAGVWLTYPMMLLGRRGNGLARGYPEMRHAIDQGSNAALLVGLRIRVLAALIPDTFAYAARVWDHNLADAVVDL